MRWKSLLLVAACVVACREPIAPVSDSYVLREIGGQSLPAPYAQNPSFTKKILGAQLLLTPDGKGFWAWTFEVDNGFSSATQGLHWTKKGNTIEITLDCSDFASCIAGPHLVGKVSEGRIDIPTSNVFRTPLVLIVGHEVGGTD